MKPDTTEAHFLRLLDIVCTYYPVTPTHIVSKRRTHNVTTPRMIVAAIWSEGNSLSDTAKRLGWSVPSSASHARDRVNELLEQPTHAWRIERIVEDVSQEMPWLVPQQEGGEA